MKKIITILFLIIVSNIVFAQFDSTFVHITRKKFVITPLYEFYKSRYRIRNVINNNDKSYKEVEQTYSSKNNVYLGLGVSFYRIGFTIAFLLPYSNVPELKNTKSFSFMGGYSVKKLYAELRYRNYNGFEKDVYTYTNDTVIADYTINRDLNFQQVGGMLYYFSSKKYNYDANYKNYNIQKKSAITPLIIGGANYFNIKGEFEIIDSTNAKIVTREIDVFSLKTGGGLAGTLVFHKFYATVLSYIGASINNNKITENKNSETYTKMYPSFEFRSSFGYNSNGLIAAFTFTYDNDLIYFKPAKIGINNFYMNIKIGYKFNSKYLGRAKEYL